MNCCNPEVTASSDLEQPSSGADGDFPEASVYGETRGSDDAAEDADAASVGFGIGGAGEGKVVLGRVSRGDDKDLRYLHLLWESGRAEVCAGGVASTLRKMTGSRARRQHRMVRNLGPIGKDIYGKYFLF